MNFSGLSWKILVINNIWMSDGGPTVWLLVAAVFSFLLSPMCTKVLRSYRKTQGVGGWPGVYLGAAEGVTVNLENPFRSLDSGSSAVFSTITVI